MLELVFWLAVWLVEVLDIIIGLVRLWGRKTGEA
jgi:hypothetical protein